MSKLSNATVVSEYFFPAMGFLKKPCLFYSCLKLHSGQEIVWFIRSKEGVAQSDAWFYVVSIVIIFICHCYYVQCVTQMIHHDIYKLE